MSATGASCGSDTERRRMALLTHPFLYPYGVFHIPFIEALPEFELVSIFERKATPQVSAARDAHPSVKVVNTLQQAS